MVFAQMKFHLLNPMKLLFLLHQHLHLHLLLPIHHPTFLKTWSFLILNGQVITTTIRTATTATTTILITCACGMKISTSGICLSTMIILMVEIESRVFTMIFLSISAKEWFWIKNLGHFSCEFVKVKTNFQLGFYLFCNLDVSFLP